MRGLRNWKLGRGGRLSRLPASRVSEFRTIILTRSPVAGRKSAVGLGTPDRIALADTANFFSYVSRYLRAIAVAGCMLISNPLFYSL